MFTNELGLHFLGLPHLLISLIILLIGIYRILNVNSKSIPFALLCFSLFIWNFGIALNLFSTEDPFVHLYRRFYYLGICFFPVAFYYYSITFLNYFNNKTRLILIGCSAFSTLFFIFAFFNFYFIIGSNHYFFGYYAKYGITGWAFVVYASFIMFSTFFTWIRFFQNEKNQAHRHRIQIITFGLLIFLPILIDFLPTINIEIYPFGVFFSLLFILFQNYAVFTLRIVQLQTLANFILRYSVIVALAILPWSIFSWSYFMFFHTTFMNLIIPFSIVSFLLLIPYIRFGIPWLNQNLFYKEHAYHSLLQNFLHETYRLKTVSKLTSYTQSIFKKNLNVQNVFLIFKKNKTELFDVSLSSESIASCPQEFIQLIPWFLKRQAILFRYDVNTFPEFSEIRDDAERAFVCFDAQLFIPLVHADQFLGAIVVGEKSEHSFFKNYELDFLEQLKKIATIALNNSYLYEQIRTLGKISWEGHVNLNEMIKSQTQALETALSKMKVLNDEQADFFTMASHNLRTPLTSIKASATLLWGDITESSTENNDLKIVLYNNIRRLEMLIRYIIEIVKMDEGKQEFIDGSTIIFSPVKKNPTRDY